MLSIYTTEDIISAIYKDGEDKYTAWYDLITKNRPNLKVLLDENTDYDTDDYNPVYMLKKDFDINVEPEYAEVVGESSYLASIANMQQKSVADPCAIFILNIDKETAKQISDKYGVICHSFNEPPIDCPLFQDGGEKCINKDEKCQGWQELIVENITIPSNSLIFIDRYLFSEDRNSKIDDGIENITEILQKALPKDCGVEFHILFIFDASKIPDNVTFQDISTKLNKIKKKLNKSYTIVIETLSVCKQNFKQGYDYLYEKTHNRRILSNYYIIRVEHSLKAFKDNKGLYTQTLWLDWAVSKGVVRQLRSDTPAKALYKTIKEIRTVVSKLEVCPFSKNGNTKIPITDISHRLII